MPGDTIEAIVGLGNPGDKYDRTRHNAGFWFVDELARRHGGQFRPENKLHGLVCVVQIAGKSIRLLKPDTFMNRSGLAVQSLAAYFKIGPSQMLVAHDELDLPPGTVKMKHGGGHGGHNGLRDIIAQLGADFARMRIGIGHPGDRSQVLNYVLGQPGRDEQSIMDESLARAANVTEEIFTHHWNHAVHSLHSKAPAVKPVSIKEN